MVDKGHGSSMIDWLTSHQSGNRCMVDHGHESSNNVWLTMVMEVAMIIHG